MKSTGIVRKLDKLGRIVLPKELRDTLGFASMNEIEYSVDGDLIVLQLYTEKCYICGSTNFEVSFKGKNICKDCITTISEL